MFVHTRTAIAVFSLVLASGAENRTKVDATKETLAKWVETRQLISRIRSDWEADRDVLQQSIQLFEKELAAIEEQFNKTDAAGAQVQKEKQEFLGQKEALDAAAERVKELLGPIEQSLREFSKALPAPLLTRIDPLLNRMPNEPANTRMSGAERMQNVVGILSEIDKFNGSITVHYEIQKNSAGEEVQVRTLYLGLGQAFRVDKAGRAAVGVPGPGGWQWTEKGELASGILQAIAIYENSQPPAFVSLPISLN